MKQMLKLFLVITAYNSISCTIDGLSYMDDIKQRYLDTDKKFLRGEDPCNPPYWYPRDIPEFCMHKVPPLLPKTEVRPPEPVPIPVPIAPYPYPVPMPPLPMPPMPPIPMPGPMPMPAPLLPMPMPMPLPPLPYGIPIQPSAPIIPVLSNSYPMPMPFPMPHPPFPMPAPPFPMPAPPFPMPPPPFPMPQPYGFMPGVSGMVSRDGGINILPFSDPYSDMLEKHKQKMMRKEMQYIIDKYNKKHKWHGSKRL